jgi:hypothetical protein
MSLVCPRLSLTNCSSLCGVSAARIIAIDWLQLRLLDAPAENAQLVAKEEQLNLTVAAAQLEREQTDEEA